MHSAFIPIQETIKPVHYCKIIDKASKVKEGNLFCPDNDSTIEAMLYWYSQRHVHEVFIFITIRQKEATLMIIIARSPVNRSLNQLRYHIATTIQHRRAREEPQKPDAYVLLSLPRDYGDACFYFLFWMLKSQSLHTSSLKKKTDIKLRKGRPKHV